MGMRVLYAISDLHVGLRENRELLMRMPAHPEDWLIIAGDVGETEEHLEFAWRVLKERFARLFWAPGNHELWVLPSRAREPKGEARYALLVEICRRHGVTTPEDPYVLWEGAGGPCLLAPLFLLYDYSFRPDDVAESRAVEWAMESGVLCTDEQLLSPDPHPSIAAWCHERLRLTEARLTPAAAAHPLVLINHFPLRADLVRIPAIPRFSIWCGTVRTQDWHLRFRAQVVVSGHLHVPRTDWRDGVRFEEVSLGNPAACEPRRLADVSLRQILPAPIP